MAITNPDFDLSSSSSPVSKTDFDPPSTTAVNDSDVTFTDITTGNASATKHGFLKKLSNVATEFLNGAGNFVTLAQSSVVDLVTDLAAKIAGSTGSTDNAILRADGTGGKTSQSSGILIDDSNNISLPTQARATQNGMITQDGTRFIHTYYPSGIALGNNLFVGRNAGNFTMTSGGASYNTSYNTGIGVYALNALTDGYYNTCIGFYAGTLITSGIGNFAMGALALSKVTTTHGNTAVGSESGEFTTGTDNTLIGGYTGQGSAGSSTYSKNTVVGKNGGISLTTGGNNILVGWHTGDALTTGGNNIIIGYDIDASSATASNELNIGGVIKGVGINAPTTVSIGIGGTPNANAVLDCQSTTKAFMPPRMTTTQRDAVASPTAGMVIYNSTTNKLNVYTTAWESVTSA